MQSRISHRHRIPFFFVLLILLISCRDEPATPTVRPIPSATATEVVLPTDTPQPTATPLPTNTATPLPPTLTPTPLPPTATNTPLPPTATNTPPPPTSTNTPIPPTVTPLPSATAAATAQATAEATVAATGTPLTSKVVVYNNQEVLETIVVIATSLDLPIGDDPVLTLADGSMTLQSTQYIFGLPIESIFVVQVSAENGEPQVILTSATVNGEPLPPESVAELEIGIANGFTQALKAQLNYDYIESIDITAGQMTIRYR